MRKIQVRWARLLVVGLSVAVVLLLRENAALQVERHKVVVSLRRPITEVEVGSSQVIPILNPIMAILNGYSVVDRGVVDGRPRIEVEAAPGTDVELVAPDHRQGEWVTVDHELGTGMNGMTLEWRAAPDVVLGRCDGWLVVDYELSSHGPPTPIWARADGEPVDVRTTDVRDRLRRAPTLDESAGGAFTFDLVGLLSPEELLIALRAMARGEHGLAAPTSIDVRDGQLVVCDTEAGHARIAAALERLQDPVGVDGAGPTTRVAYDVRETGFEAGLHAPNAIEQVLRAMTGLWSPADEESGRTGLGQLTGGGQVQVTQTAEGHERVRRALAALRRAAAARSR